MSDYPRWGDTRQDREALDRHLTDQPEEPEEFPEPWEPEGPQLYWQGQPVSREEWEARMDPGTIVGRILSGPGTEEPWIVKTDLGFWYRFRSPQFYSNLSDPDGDEVCVGHLIAVECHQMERMIGAV